MGAHLPTVEHLCSKQALACAHVLSLPLDLPLQLGHSFAFDLLLNQCLVQLALEVGSQLLVHILHVFDLPEVFLGQVLELSFKPFLQLDFLLTGVFLDLTYSVSSLVLKLFLKLDQCVVVISYLLPHLLCLKCLFFLCDLQLLP